MRKIRLCSNITSNIWLCLCEHHFGNEGCQILSGLKYAKGQRVHVKTPCISKQTTLYNTVTLCG